jgi:hypothetical protein
MNNFPVGIEGTSHGRKAGSLQSLGSLADIANVSDLDRPDCLHRKMTTAYQGVPMKNGNFGNLFVDRNVGQGGKTSNSRGMDLEPDRWPVRTWR